MNEDVVYSVHTPYQVDKVTGAYYKVPGKQEMVGGHRTYKGKSLGRLSSRQCLVKDISIQLLLACSFLSDSSSYVNISAL